VGSSCGAGGRGVVWRRGVGGGGGGGESLVRWRRANEVLRAWRGRLRGRQHSRVPERVGKSGEWSAGAVKQAMVGIDGGSSSRGELQECRWATMMELGFGGAGS